MVAVSNEAAKEAATKPADTIKFLAAARKRFDRCIEATSVNRAYQLDDVKFAAGSPDNGWQWPVDVLNARMKDPNGARPTLTINKLIQHIKLVTNEQRKNKPMGRILPVDDKGDTEVAEVLNGIVRHIEVASHADVAYDTACESQVTMGEGYWRILTDYCDEQSFEQDIRINPIKNAFSVYMDPDSLKRDSVGRLCEYGFVTERMPLARYESEFPKAKSKVDWDTTIEGDDNFAWFDDEGVLIAEYFYVEKKRVKIVQWSDGSVTQDDAMPENVGLMPVQERQTEVREVKWCKINGLEVLEESEWAGKFIPIVRVVGNEWDVEGQLVTSGIVRNAKDPQRMVNYWASQDAELNALAPKAPFVGAVGQFEGQEGRWRDANTVNFAYLEYNPVDVNGNVLPPPQRQQPPQPAAAIITAKMQAGDDMQSVIGQYNPSLGAEAKEKSGRAIMARQQQADVGTFHYVDNLSRSIGYSTEIILDLIPKIYDTRRVARIIGEDGEPDHATLSVGMGAPVTQETDDQGAIQKIYDPSMGRYDVVVSVGPSFQTKRLEAAEFLTASAQAAKDPITAQIFSYLSLKSQDWPEADEAADMIKKMLPPQVLESEDDDPNAPEVARQKLQQAAQALGQHEAQLNQMHEQVVQAAQEATALEDSAKSHMMQAKEAEARAQAKVDEINAAQATLDAQRELFGMQQKLAMKEIEIERTTMQADRDILQAEVKVIQANMDKKLAELNSASEIQDHKEAAGESTMAVLEKFSTDLSKMLSIATAERELVYDDQGEPIGSRVILPQSETVQ